MLRCVRFPPNNPSPSAWFGAWGPLPSVPSSMSERSELSSEVVGGTHIHHCRLRLFFSRFNFIIQWQSQIQFTHPFFEFISPIRFESTNGEPITYIIISIFSFLHCFSFSVLPVRWVLQAVFIFNHPDFWPRSMICWGTLDQTWWIDPNTLSCMHLESTLWICSSIAIL